MPGPWRRLSRRSEALRPRRREPTPPLAKFCVSFSPLHYPAAVTISLLRRRRERRQERARVQKALADLAAAFRVPAESTAPANFAIAAAPPSGFATVLRIDDLFVGTNDPKWRDPQLHLGSGPQAIEGWINIDNLPYPGVDLIWDLAR